MSRITKTKFLEWAKEHNIELTPRLTDVFPDAPVEFKEGDIVTFKNDYGVEFPLCEIFGIAKDPGKYGSCIYWNSDAYWAPAKATNFYHGLPETSVLVKILINYYKDNYYNVDGTLYKMLAFNERVKPKGDGKYVFDINVKCVIIKNFDNDIVGLSKETLTYNYEKFINEFNAANEINSLEFEEGLKQVTKKLSNERIYLHTV